MLMSVKQINGFWAFLTVIIGLSFSSCEIINPEEDIPSYIHIDSIALNADYKAPYNISDAWLYVNGNLQGVFELPATIPVLAGGINGVQIAPGIKINGIALTRMAYPFFELYETNIELFRDSVISISPVTSYKGTTKWEENFEDIGYTLQATGNSDTTVNRITDPAEVFQGTGCAQFALSAEQTAIEVISSNTFQLPKGGTAVFLEIHYKCNNTFSVGIFSNTVSQLVQIPPSLVINPREEWNRIYINLTNEVSAQAQAIDYNIYFYMEKDGGNATAEAYVDNIRLVHL